MNSKVSILCFDLRFSELKYRVAHVGRGVFASLVRIPRSREHILRLFCPTRIFLTRRCCGLPSPPICFGPKIKTKPKMKKWHHLQNMFKQEICTNLVSFCNKILAFDIAFIISKQEVSVPFHKDITNVLKFIWIIRTEESILDLIDALFRFWQFVIIVPSVVSSSLEVLDFVHGHTEDEDVFISHFFGHLHVRSV